MQERSVIPATALTKTKSGVIDGKRGNEDETCPSDLIGAACDLGGLQGTPWRALSEVVGSAVAAPASIQRRTKDGKEDLDAGGA